MASSTVRACGALLRTTSRLHPSQARTISPSARRALVSYSGSIRREQLRVKCGSFPALSSAAPRYEGQRRYFAADGSNDDESDDDFKPKRKAVSDNPDEISGLIKKQVEGNPVMVYMKGTPSEPRCGFSGQVVRILHAQGVSFSSVNVLDYPSLREGVKSYTEWPTIPQVFVKGEFVGGCDIMTQMHESGDLETMFKDAKLRD